MIHLVEMGNGTDNRHCQAARSINKNEKSVRSKGGTLKETKAARRDSNFFITVLKTLSERFNRSATRQEHFFLPEAVNINTHIYIFLFFFLFLFDNVAF